MMKKRSSVCSREREQKKSKNMTLYSVCAWSSKINSLGFFFYSWYDSWCFDERLRSICLFLLSLVVTVRCASSMCASQFCFLLFNSELYFFLLSFALLLVLFFTLWHYYFEYLFFVFSLVYFVLVSFQSVFYSFSFVLMRSSMLKDSHARLFLHRLSTAKRKFYTHNSKNGIKKCLVCFFSRHCRLKWQ